MSLPIPPAFLTRRVHIEAPSPGITGLCVGYQLGEWRMEELADHVLDWLPEFALNWSEVQGLHPGNARQLVRRAARAVYDTDAYGRRGEFGEILLHIAIRQVFGSLPAISKVYYKDSANDTVKGFDCVHTVEVEDRLELWLGEAKFYSNISQAVTDACRSLADHMEPTYLRAESVAILNKVDPSTPSAERLRRLLQAEISLDEIFDAIVIPVLLTYDSTMISAFDRVCDAYCRAFEEEISKHHETFSQKNPLTNLRVHLFLLPLKSKETFQIRLHEKLRVWQTA